MWRQCCWHWWTNNFQSIKFFKISQLYLFLCPPKDLYITSMANILCRHFATYIYFYKSFNKTTAVVNSSNSAHIFKTFSYECLNSYFEEIISMLCQTLYFHKINYSIKNLKAFFQPPLSPWMSEACSSKRHREKHGSLHLLRVALTLS